MSEQKHAVISNYFYAYKYKNNVHKIKNGKPRRSFEDYKLVPSYEETSL